MSNSIFWYDYETFGTDPARDRPVRVSAARSSAAMPEPHCAFSSRSRPSRRGNGCSLATNAWLGARSGRSFLSVATLLWTGTLPESDDGWNDKPMKLPRASLARLVPRDTPPIAALAAALPIMALRDPNRFDAAKHVELERARRILLSMPSAIAGAGIRAGTDVAGERAADAEIGGRIVGHHSVVGSNVWLPRSIAPYSMVTIEKPKLVERERRRSA